MKSVNHNIKGVIEGKKVIC